GHRRVVLVPRAEGDDDLPADAAAGAVEDLGPNVSVGGGKTIGPDDDGAAVERAGCGRLGLVVDGARVDVNLRPEDRRHRSVLQGRAPQTPSGQGPALADARGRGSPAEKLAKKWKHGNSFAVRSPGRAAGAGRRAAIAAAEPTPLPSPNGSKLTVTG